jgi:hypothetical protein
MAIMDKKLEFHDASALAGNSGATLLGNTIDVGPAVNIYGTAVNPNVGRGEPIYLHARINAVLAGHPATGTLALFLQHSYSTTAASFTNLVNLNLAGAASMTQNKLTAGKLVYTGALPAGCRRYLRVKATIGGATTTGGTLDAWLDNGSLPKMYE